MLDLLFLIIYNYLIKTISCKSTLPSLVNLIYPAPPTSILSVPFGPRLDFIISYKLEDADIFIAAAWFLRRSSALEFKYCKADI